MGQELTPFTLFKNVYSMILLIFSITLVMGLIFTEQTNLSKKVHPGLAVVTLWAAIIWLSMVEGGQASLVGLAPVDRELYKESHPLSYKQSLLVHTGDNLNRYLLGRQFMVVLIVFTVNFSGAPLGGADLWGLPTWLTNIFLVTGFAMILLTCMVGQLNTQVNASHCMLDYINNFFAIFTHYTAMFIEFVGILHVGYLIQIIVGILAGKPIESNEGEKSIPMKIFFWVRVVGSLALLCFCLAVTFESLFAGRTTMWKGVPPVVAVIIFFILMGIVGMLEGMQIAFFAVSKITEAERGEAKCAKMTCDLLYTGEGMNLPGFMIGRQLCVVSCMFFIARVTTVTEGDPIFGLADSAQKFFGTGLQGAVITTVLASVSWQLVASAFPIAFLSNPLTYILLRWCLFLESTGICNGAWVLAAIHRKIVGFQRDEVYIGTAEDRAKSGNVDQSRRIPRGAGQISTLPIFIEKAPKSLQDLVKNNPDVAKYLEEQNK
jgi:silicon transporter